MGVTLQRPPTQSAEVTDSWMPRGLHPRWTDVIRSVVGKIRDRNGPKSLTIVTVNVVVDETGTPIIWGEPKAKRILPINGAQAALTDILNGLVADS